MNSTSSIAVSGMHYAQQQLAATAHNIANLPMPGFQRTEVAAAAMASGGVSTTLRPTSVVGESLDQDIVAMLQAKNTFLANYAVFKATTRMSAVLVSEKA